MRLLAQNDHAVEVTIPLYRGGAIAGRVVDANGGAVENARVTVLWLPRSGRPLIRASTQTNERGDFRIGKLATQSASIVVGRGATASGRIVFEGVTPPPILIGASRVPIINAGGPGCRAATAIVATDWTFTADGLGGTCSAPPQPFLERWVLKAVMVDGRNLMEEDRRLRTRATLRQRADCDHRPPPAP